MTRSRALRTSKAPLLFRHEGRVAQSAMRRALLLAACLAACVIASEAHWGERGVGRAGERTGMGSATKHRRAAAVGRKAPPISCAHAACTQPFHPRCQSKGHRCLAHTCPLHSTILSQLPFLPCLLQPARPRWPARSGAPTPCAWSTSPRIPTPTPPAARRACRPTVAPNSRSRLAVSGLGERAGQGTGREGRRGGCAWRRGALQRLRSGPPPVRTHVLPAHPQSALCTAA